MSKVVVEEVKLNRDGLKDKMKPIQVGFAHGFLNRDGVSDMKVGAFSDGLSDKEFVAVCESGGLYYMGNTAHQNKTQNVYIGLRNKKTNKIKLVEISKINLLPVNQESSDSDSDKEDKVHIRNKDFSDKYGLKKGQRVLNQAEKLTVKSESMETALQNAAESVSVSELDLLPSKAGLYDEMLPPRNIDADQSSSVYLMEDIIGEEHFSALKKLGESILSGQFEMKEGKFSPYFLWQLETIKFMEETKKQRMMGALLFTECLITLANVKGRMIGFKDLSDTFPRGVKNHVIDYFTSAKEGTPKRNFPQQLRERVIAHVIVLALIIGNCSFDFETLRASLNMDSPKFEPFIRIVGAYVDRKNKSSPAIVNLRLPLAQPARKRMVSKKK